MNIVLNSQKYNSKVNQYGYQMDCNEKDVYKRQVKGWKMICRKEAYSMSDKNPKHPLKKKKAAAKINIADHAAVEEAREAHKSKKHVYWSQVTK